MVIDQTYALEPAEYKLSTFLENINVSHDSCFSFVSNRSIWRFDKRIGASGTLGNRSILIAKLQIHIFHSFNDPIDFSITKKWYNRHCPSFSLRLVWWRYLPAPVGSWRSNRSFLPNGELHNNLLQEPCKGMAVWVVFSLCYLFPFVWLINDISRTRLLIRGIIITQEEGVTEIGPEMCTRSISEPMEPITLPCQWWAQMNTKTFQAYLQTVATSW